MTIRPLTETTTVAAHLDRTDAAVWRGGRDIAVESVPVPALQRGEVLVRVRLATVCGSDRHTVSGRRDQPCPSVLGHETVGEIVEIAAGGARGADGDALRVGQRVIWSVTLGCGACDRCRRGVTAKCRTVRKAGHEALDSGWGLSGGYARHVLLPAGLAVAVVDDALADAVAAPAACATATVMAVAERAGRLTDRRVVVVGAGMLGLTAIAAAAWGGASAVTSVDVDRGRRYLARRFGATEAVALVSEAGPADVLLEFSGSSSALQEGLRALDVQGVAVLAGAVAPDADVAMTPESVVRRQLAIFGVHNYEPRHLTAALGFLRDSSLRFPWADLVAPPRPLEDVVGLLLEPAGVAPRDAVAP
ncbi:alcohol dehydrogenase catalytic domain-containing protein [Mycobacterium sp. AT1]|uniref:alcohol dehydrogenase catalytic domain-containing protein n=1 Tax=Mycobacterium sp. AT1 TaxID=1961706 RepID=UPI0009AD2BE5|nr:alcohol dehydrogenase catalytic domain-containing protein [Mycobacterium sp. AT1]OPX08123.1 dehydrogenase [Mycobacterium sp. AT1]